MPMCLWLCGHLFRAIVLLSSISLMNCVECTCSLFRERYGSGMCTADHDGTEANPPPVAMGQAEEKKLSLSPETHTAALL